MIVDMKVGNGQQIVTVQCALCGALKGEGFERFSAHLRNEHDFDDLAIDEPLLSDRWARDEEVVEG